MGRQKRGRDVSGIVLLDKPRGASSNRALQTVKRLYGARKAGHTGSLDPMATGVLPLCLGEATKFSQYLLNADKAYQATIRLGEQTDTGDAEGEVIARCDTTALTRAQAESVLPQFVGEIDQVPPMYSALKVDGQPLYKLARQGIEIERKARRITIYKLVMTAFRPGPQAELDIEVECSKGTYIRTLAEDIAAALGDLGGHLVMLRRTRVGIFSIADCHDLATLQQQHDTAGETALDQWLIAPEQAVNHLPGVAVSVDTGYYVRRGQAVRVAGAPPHGLVRIHQEDGVFLGIGEILDDGRIAPRRLVVAA